jgi:hypothetical protein
MPGDMILDGFRPTELAVAGRKENLGKKTATVGTPVMAANDPNEATIQKFMAWLQYDGLCQSGEGEGPTLERYRIEVEQAVLAEFVAYRLRSPSPASLLAKALATAEAQPTVLPKLPALKKKPAKRNRSKR